MRTRSVFAIASCVLHVALPSTLLAQDAAPSRSGRRSLLHRTDEIALARSAAPAAVSDSATVYVLTDSGYTVAALENATSLGAGECGPRSSLPSSKPCMAL